MLVELLKRQGVDASMSLPPDFDDRFQKGQYTGAIYGHGGGVNDPYYTLRLYQSSTVAVPGAHLVNFARWKNEAYDKIVDDVFVTDMRNKTAPAGALPQGDGDLAPRPAGHPAGPQHPPHPHEHDLLDRTGRRRRRPTSTAPSGTSPTRWCSGISSRRSSDRRARPASGGPTRRAGPSSREPLTPAGRRIRALVHARGSLGAVSASYLLRRIGVFLLIAWLAATLNFFLPRLTGQDPVRVKLLQQAQLGGYVQAGIDEMVKEYDRRFGLDRPLWEQYLTLPAATPPGSTSTTPSPTTPGPSTR